MTDENKQRLQDECDDAALELLMNEYAEIEGAALWREFQAAKAAEVHTDTLKREDGKRSRGSKEKNRRCDFLNRFGNGFKRAAVIFLVLVLLLSPLAMSVEAFKLPVLNYIMALEKKFSGFNFGTNDELNQQQMEVLEIIQSEPCPEGHQISDYQIGPYGKIWIDFEYQGRIAMTISILPSEGQINIDTEDVEQVSMKIQDYEAVYLQKNGHRLMWMDGKRELMFDLRAYELMKEDFWRYAYQLTAKLSQ